MVDFRPPAHVLARTLLATLLPLLISAASLDVPGLMDAPHHDPTVAPPASLADYLQRASNIIDARFQNLSSSNAAAASLFDSLPRVYAATEVVDFRSGLAFGKTAPTDVHGRAGAKEAYGWDLEWSEERVEELRRNPERVRDLLRVYDFRYGSKELDIMLVEDEERPKRRERWVDLRQSAFLLPLDYRNARGEEPRAAQAYATGFNWQKRALLSLAVAGFPRSTWVCDTGLFSQLLSKGENLERPTSDNWAIWDGERILLYAELSRYQSGDLKGQKRDPRASDTPQLFALARLGSPWSGGGRKAAGELVLAPAPVAAEPAVESSAPPQSLWNMFGADGAVVSLSTLWSRRPRELPPLSGTGTDSSSSEEPAFLPERKRPARVADNWALAKGLYLVHRGDVGAFLRAPPGTWFTNVSFSVARHRHDEASTRQWANFPQVWFNPKKCKIYLGWRASRGAHSKEVGVEF